MPGEDRLAALLPRIMREMQRINELVAVRDRRAAVGEFHALADLTVRARRDDLSCRGHLLAGHTTDLSVCRIPAEARAGMPIAVFLPGLLSFLPLAVARVLSFADRFDIVLCELPGHGASGAVDDVSLAAFAAEIATLLDTALNRAGNLFLIGESLGGLVALALARLRPARVANVVLVDPPFHLTRPDLAAWIREAWCYSGRRPYIRRICREIMGFDPADGRELRSTLHHDLVGDAAYNCLVIAGSDRTSSGVASVVTPVDVAALRAINPGLLLAPRVPDSGHAVLLDNPDGARAALEAFLVHKSR